MPTQGADTFVGKVTHDAAVAAAKLSPPAAAMMFGLTLNEWVAVATIVYIILQAAYLAWRWTNEWRKRRAGG